MLMTNSCNAVYVEITTSEGSSAEEADAKGRGKFRSSLLCFLLELNEVTAFIMVSGDDLQSHIESLLPERHDGRVLCIC